ncbi:MAG: hypothetical protein PHI52_02180, partial [Bacteroidales bacterium]|nr:hypothetical protein [Bacteroidales bacterium]
VMLKVYDYEKLEGNRKLNIPGSDENILDCKARCIKKDGTIIELTQSDMVEVDDDGDKDNFLILDKAETEDVLEFYYIIRKSSIMEDGSYYFPGNYPIKKAEFTMIMPDYLKSEFTLYNGLSEITDTIFEQKELRYTYITAENLPKISDQEMSFYDAYEPRIEFVLAYNYSRGKMRLNTIGSISQNLYTIIAEPEKAEIKLLKKFASQIPINKKMSTLEKVQAIENYVKKEILFINFNASFFSDLTFGLKNKMTNVIGFTKIYYYLLNYYKIDNQVVFTNDKTYKRFDKSFNGPNYLRDVMFYIPEIKQYIAPTFRALRVGLTPSVLAGQDALFLEPVTVGNLTSFVPIFKSIPVLDKKYSGDSIDVHVSVDLNKKILRGHIKRVMTGYYGFGLQFNLPDMEEEDKNEVIDHYLALGSESISLDAVEIVNATPEDIFAHPLVMNADIIDYYLTKFEENKITVTIGALIGKQSEFKQEKPRLLPVERTHKSHYYRIIVCDIPDGYTCVNYNDIAVKVTDKDEQAVFLVKTKKEGNTIVIESEEFYDCLFYPVEDYESYQKVVNAAAAFNHAVLIFEKQ